MINKLDNIKIVEIIFLNSLFKIFLFIFISVSVGNIFFSEVKSKIKLIFDVMLKSDVI